MKLKEKSIVLMLIMLVLISVNTCFATTKGCLAEQEQNGNIKSEIRTEYLAQEQVDEDFSSEIKVDYVEQSSKENNQIIVTLSNGKKYTVQNKFSSIFGWIAYRINSNGEFELLKQFNVSMVTDSNIISSKTNDETICFTDNTTLDRNSDKESYIIEVGLKKSADGKTFDFANFEAKGKGVAKIKNDPGIRILKDTFYGGKGSCYFVFVGLNENERTYFDKIYETTKEIVMLNFLSLTYTGEEINIKEYVESHFKEIKVVSGETVATEPGNYKVTLSLLDKDKYAWNVYVGEGRTPTSEDQTVEWHINKILYTLYSPSQRILKTYNGEEQEITFEDLKEYRNYLDKKYFDITGNKATEVGTYQMKLTLNDPAHVEIYKRYPGKFEEEDNVIPVEWEIVDDIKCAIVKNCEKQGAKSVITLSNGEKYTIGGDYSTIVNNGIIYRVNRDGELEVLGSLSKSMVGNAKIISSQTNDEAICFADNTTLDRNSDKESYIIEVGLKKSSDGKTFEFTSCENKGKGVVNIKNEPGVRILERTFDAGKYSCYFVFVGLNENEKTLEKNVYETTKEILRVPNYWSETYTGEKIDISTKINTDHSKYKVISGETVATELGAYTITVSLVDKEKYAWAVYGGDGRTPASEDQTVEWHINKILYTLYSPSQRILKTYNGEEQEITFEDLKEYRNYLDKKYFDITGNKATEVGTYQMKLTLNDPAHVEIHKLYPGKFEEEDNVIPVEWEIVDEDGIRCAIVKSLIEQDDKYIITLSNREEYTVSKRPSAMPNNGIIYRVSKAGELEILDKLWSLDVDDAKIISSQTNDEAICFVDNTTLDRNSDKESYIFEIELKKSSDGKTYSFASIKNKGKGIVNIKNEPGVRILKDTFDDGKYPCYFVFVGLDENERTCLDKIYETTKEIIRKSYGYGTTYTGEKMNVNTLIDSDYRKYMVVSGETEAVEPGNYTITVSLVDKEKYAWNVYSGDGRTPTSEDQTVVWKIGKVENYLYKPSQKILKTYTGKEQEVTFEELDFDGFIYKKWFDITGNKATEVGTYQMKLTLNDTTRAELRRYYPNQEEENVITVEWEIQKAQDTECLHDLEKIAKVNATTKKPGNIEYYKCRVCGKLFKDSKAEKEITEADTIIPKKTSSGGSGGGGSSRTETYTTKVINKSSQGTVTVSPEKVKEGRDQKITIVPKEGYKVVDVKINGKSVGAVLKYTIKDVEDDNKVEVLYEKESNKDLDNSGDNHKVDNAKSFTDVKTGDWYKNAVDYVCEKSLFKGTSETEFSPSNTMNRAMLVTVLHRLAGESKAKTEASQFTDVEPNSYYVEAVNWAVENDIINGVDANTFGSKKDISREQLVTILYRYAKLTNKVSDENLNSLSKYEDKEEIADYAKVAFAWAVDEEIINGRTATTLAPKGTGTRAEVATMIMRFAEKMK